METNLNILIVHTDRVAQYFFQRAFRLTDLDLQASYSSNGYQAVMELNQAMQQGKVPDVLLLSLFLPGMSGFETVQWVRKQRLLDGMAVVVMTSTELEQETRRALSLRADRCVPEPEHPDEFVSLVEQLPGYCLDVEVSKSISRRLAA